MTLARFSPTRREFGALLGATTLTAALGSRASAGGDARLKMSWPRDVGPLNPHMYNPSQFFAQNWVYDGLVSYGKGGEILPALASAWTVSEDGKTLTFKLRDGVRFSDGSPFDSAVALRNFKDVLAARDQHDWLELINQIDDVSAPDAGTLRIALKSAYYPALQELTLIRPLRFLAAAGFPDKGLTKDGIKAPIGTGPWKLSDHKVNEYAVFERNEHYWGPKPALEAVTVRIIPDGVTRVLSLKNGDIDLIFGAGVIGLSDFDELRKSGQFQTYVSAPILTRLVVINANRGPTADKAVRQAIQHGFNRKEAVEGLFYGVEKPAEMLFAPDVPYCDVPLSRPGYDKAAAERLLDGAGWQRPAADAVRMKDGVPLALDVSFIATDEINKSIAQLLQAQLREIGIDLRLLGEEKQSNVRRAMEGGFNLAFSGTWGAPYDPHTFCASMRVANEADYQAQLGLPDKKEIDALISTVLVTTDKTARARTYATILRKLDDGAIYLPVSYEANVAVLRKGIQGFSFDQQEFEIPTARLSV